MGTAGRGARGRCRRGAVGASADAGDAARPVICGGTASRVGTGAARDRSTDRAAGSGADTRRLRVRVCAGSGRPDPNAGPDSNPNPNARRDPGSGIPRRDRRRGERGARTDRVAGRVARTRPGRGPGARRDRHIIAAGEDRNTANPGGA